ncbi:MAG: hypothetical protein WA814_01685 [Candidatus Baltobacteraceae bacterium]
MANPPAARSVRRESRIFPAFVVLSLPVILAMLPSRFQLVPRGVPFVLAAVLAIPMLAAGFLSAPEFWTRVERYAAWIVLPLTTIIQLVLLGLLVQDMAQPHADLSGLTLLSTAVAIWATNILIFALAYWQMDRGGPLGRMRGWQGRADFTFARGDPCDGVPDDWQPIFADYLALAFNTSTAFSPTDTLPLTPRAKMMLMVQSLISLVAVVAVGARAINILGS